MGWQRKTPKGPGPLVAGQAERGAEGSRSLAQKISWKRAQAQRPSFPSRSPSEVRASPCPCPSATSLQERWLPCALLCTQAGSGHCTAARCLAYCRVSRSWSPRPCRRRASSFAVRSPLAGGVLCPPFFLLAGTSGTAVGRGSGQTRKPWLCCQRLRTDQWRVRVWFPHSVSSGFCQTFRYCNLLDDKW